LMAGAETVSICFGHFRSSCDSKFPEDTYINTGTS
jgi:hypothetical protein